MTESKHITDELRKFVPQINGYKLLRPCDEKELLAIADRIDAAHEEALSKVYMDMSDSEWFLLPKDIDDKPINEHDKIDWCDHEGTWHKNATVLAVCRDGCYVMDSTVFFHVNKSDIRHHQAPTVEDLLQEMLDKWGRLPYNATNEAIVAEYAAKLRLADDAE